MTPPKHSIQRMEPAVQLNPNSCVTGGWLPPLMPVVGQRKPMKFPVFNRKKNHLEYTSIASWFHGESVPKGFGVEYGSGRRPDFKVYVEQYCELRQHLFDKHLKTLPDEIQEQLKARQHPSQSHSRIKQAEPVLQKLRDILAGLDFVEDVSIKNAQMDLVQFNVKLKHEPTLEQWEMIPEYLEGYVINTVWIPKG